MKLTVNYSKLSQQVKADLAEFVQENGAIADARPASVLDAYLRWNGIIGYTGQILNIFNAAERN